MQLVLHRFPPWLITQLIVAICCSGLSGEITFSLLYLCDLLNSLLILSFSPTSSVPSQTTPTQKFPSLDSISCSSEDVHWLGSNCLEIVKYNSAGFQPISSTQEAIISATTNWHKLLDTKANVAAVFFDLSKAVDTIPHSGILNALSNVGVSGPLYSGYSDICPIDNSVWYYISRALLQLSGALVTKTLERNLGHVYRCCCGSCCFQGTKDT